MGHHYSLLPSFGVKTLMDNGSEEKGTTAQESEVAETPHLKSLFSVKWLGALAALASLSAISMLPLFLVAGSLGIILKLSANENILRPISVVRTLIHGWQWSILFHLPRSPLSSVFSPTNLDGGTSDFAGPSW